MTKKKAPQRTRDKRRKRQEQLARKTRLRAMLAPLRILIAVLAVLASLSAILSFLPRISVNPVASVDPHAAFGTIFSLKNDGVTSLHNVNFSLCPGRVYEPTNNAAFIGGKISAADWHFDELAPGDSVGLPFDRVFTGFPNALVDAVIVIRFRPDWWPLTKQRKFRFASQRAVDGTWQWKELPVGNRCGDSPPYF